MGFFAALFKSGPPKHVHDWFFVNSETPWEIERRVDAETDGGPPKMPLPPGFSVSYEHIPCQKVCLSCGECCDEIGVYEAEYREKKRIKRERAESAKAKWNEYAQRNGLQASGTRVL